MKTVTVNGITYNVLAEEKLDGMASECQNTYESMLMLVRPKGYKKFMAMKKFNGVIEILS